MRLMNYNERTPESIKGELDRYTEAQAQELADFLEAEFANEHNGRDFQSFMKDPDSRPHEKIRFMLWHMIDWLAYGN